MVAIKSSSLSFDYQEVAEGIERHSDCGFEFKGEVMGVFFLQKSIFEEEKQNKLCIILIFATLFEF
jgi:hypothetical protein